MYARQVLGRVTINYAKNFAGKHIVQYIRTNFVAATVEAVNQIKLKLSLQVPFTFVTQMNNSKLVVQLLEVVVWNEFLR